MYIFFCHLNLWVIFREAIDFYSILKHKLLLFYSQAQAPFFLKMDPKIEEMAKYNDYVTNFDPKVYIETYYCKIEGHMFVPTTLKSQHKIYSTGN